MLKSPTDYLNYPTVTKLSNNDKNTLYMKSISHQEIMNMISRISSLEQSNKELLSRIVKLENSNTITAEQSVHLTKGAHYSMGSYAKAPIIWRVLDVRNGKALLISEKGLDCRPYHDSWEVITWRESGIRNWLNNEFYNSSFIEDEKQRILETENRSIYNAPYGTKVEEIVSDKIFLLSLSEIQLYFKDSEDRICYPTEYAVRQGVYTSKDNDGSCWWWLRSPGDHYSHAAYVHTDGIVHESGHTVNTRTFAVRPAMWITLSE